MKKTDFDLWVEKNYREKIQYLWRCAEDYVFEDEFGCSREQMLEYYDDVKAWEDATLDQWLERLDPQDWMRLHVYYDTKQKEQK